MNEFEGFDDKREDGVEYDLRDYERASYGRGYRSFNDIAAKIFANPTQENYKEYFSLARVLLKITRRYADSDEVVQNCKEVEEKVEQQLRNMNKVRDWTPEMDTINEVREAVEDLRHDANLKLPKKTRQNPEEAWKE